MENTYTLDVLRQLERGEISREEADARLSGAPLVEPIAASSAPEFEKPRWAKFIGMYLLAAGLLTVLIGAWIVAATASVNLLWLLCGLPIVLAGSLVLAIAENLRTGHWVFIDVASRKHPRPLRLAIPLPLSLLRLGLRLAQLFKSERGLNVRMQHARWQHHWQWKDADAFSAALEHELSEGRGIEINVDDKEDRVRVYIV